ncbi:hypothetical protein Tco_0074472, partial [Tanacetum coccineum]
MPLRRSSATARAAATTVARAAAAAATPMTVATVEQLIEARVFAALANHETLRNSTNGHGNIPNLILRAISGHVLRATGVQIPEDDLDNLQSFREVDVILVFVDPQDLLGFLEYTNLTTCLGDSDSRKIGFLE